MATEDGAMLGRLLGLLAKSDIYQQNSKQLIPGVLRLYERLRRTRTTVNVQGANANRYWYHLPDGAEQQRRDEELATFEWGDKTHWGLTSYDYQEDLLGFDFIEECEDAFEDWLREERRRLESRTRNICILNEAQASVRVSSHSRLNADMD